MTDDERLKARGFVKTTYAGFKGWFYRGGRDQLYDRRRALEIVTEEEKQSLYSKQMEAYNDDPQ